MTVNMANSKPEVDCLSETERADDSITAATPTFSITRQIHQCAMPSNLTF